MDRVQVWLIPTGEGHEPSAEQWALLDHAERERASRFVRPRDRDTYVLAHAWLRTVLASCTGLAPDQLAITGERLKKPSLRLQDESRPRTYFNLSHTNGLIAVAVSNQCEVGVDVERIRPWKEIESFSRSVLHPREIEVLQRMPDEDRGGYFFGVWCAKEAYTKATGLGLSHPFDSFSTGFDAAGSDWRDLRSLSVPQFPSASLRLANPVLTVDGLRGGHALAVAALGPGLDARLHWQLNAPPP